MKSWVLAFNYAFADGAGCRQHSTLLVDDPIVGPSNARTIEPEGPAVEGIIRAHLARQCTILGAGRLVPAVLLGGDASPQRVFPPVYTVRHPRIGNRSYIGWFCSLSPTGQITWSRGPMRVGPIDADVDVYVEGPGSPGFVHVRIRQRSGSRLRVDVLGSGGWTPAEGDRWVRSLLGGDAGGEVFVGQDATMLKGCIATARGNALTGEPFANALEFTDRASPRDGSYAVEVIRNGSLFADGRMVTPVEDPKAWWTSQ